MAMIKSNQAEQMMRDVIVLDLGDLRRQAEQIRQTALAEAERIRQAAGLEASQLTAGAEQKGYQAGYEAGLAEGHQTGRQAGHAEALQQTADQLKQITEAWSQALRQWESERSAMMLEARQSLMRLAVEIAAKIVKRVPQVDPLCVHEQVTAAIEHVTGPTDLTIRIHPEDRSLIEQALPTLLDTAHQVDHAELVDDARIAPGGCVVDYGQGRIDATLETQLRRMVEALLPNQIDKQDLQRIVRIEQTTVRNTETSDAAHRCPAALSVEDETKDTDEPVRPDDPTEEAPE